MIGCCVSFAAAEMKPITFGWTQDLDPANFYGWSLYMSTTSGEGYTKINDIPFDGTVQTEYTYSVPLESLERGTTLYFVLTATDGYGFESGYSNEVSRTIPVNGPMPPGQFKRVFK